MRRPIVALAISSVSLLACSNSDVDPVGTPETENPVASEEATDGATNTPTETTDSTAASSGGTPATTVANAATSGTPNTVKCVRITDFDTTNWFIVNDGVMGGRSVGDGYLDDGVLVFFGEIVTDGGGFSSLRGRLDGGLGNADRLRLRLRSDGREYELLAEDVESENRRVTHYTSIEAAGDGWQEVDVPLTAMESRIFGNPVDAVPFDPQNATQIGIILSDGNDGPFRLELDWIDACGLGEESVTADQDSDGSEAATAPSTTPTSTTTSVPDPPQAFTMAFTGDVLIHSHIWRQAERNAAEADLDVEYDFTPMFSDITARLEAVDLAVCHLEVPVRLPGNEPSTHPIYGAPREIVGDLATAGYDHCSTASNHTLDQGTDGIDLTVAAFEEAGITQSGMARTPAEIEPRLRPFTLADGSTVDAALLSYTWSFNGLSLPADEPWRSALIDPERIIEDAETARDLGADLVVVSLHWGAEKVSAVTSRQRTWAEQITASGLVDLIVGHHAHVLQPIEQVNGVWVVYGLGNVLSFHPTTDEWPAESQDAAIVSVAVTIDNGAVTVAAPEVFPTWLDKGNGRVIRDVLAGLADDETPAWRRGQLAASLERTERVLGGFVPGD